MSKVPGCFISYLSLWSYPDSKASKHLDLGFIAQIATARDNLLLRDTPTDGTVLEQLPAGTMVFSLMDQDVWILPIGKYIFWWGEVELPSGNQGWVVDGYTSKDPVFIQTLP
jgi:hypothetical protein